MMSISVQVTGPVWEPISVGVRQAGTVGHVRSPIARDSGLVSRASRRQDAGGATWARHVYRAMPHIVVLAPVTGGSSTHASQSLFPPTQL